MAKVYYTVVKDAWQNQQDKKLQAESGEIHAQAFDDQSFQQGDTWFAPFSSSENSIQCVQSSFGIHGDWF